MLHWSSGIHQRHSRVAIPWTREEDNLLLSLIHQQGAINWVRMAFSVGTRTPNQCRERYHQHLKECLNHEPISADESVGIERLVNEIGKKAERAAPRSIIARSYLPHCVHVQRHRPTLSSRSDLHSRWPAVRAIFGVALGSAPSLSEGPLSPRDHTRRTQISSRWRCSPVLQIYAGHSPTKRSHGELANR